MIKLRNPSLSSPCIIDADVIINWLAKETDPGTETPLWESPLKIFERIEAGAVDGYVSVLSLMEVRFVLRRKKKIPEEKIKEYISRIMEIVEIVVPDEFSLFKANSLQSDNLLSPFDAILIATGMSIKNSALVTRDKSLKSLASKFLPAVSPEDFLARVK